MNQNTLASLLLGVFIFLSSLQAQAATRFDELVGLHEAGPVTSQMEIKENGPLSFICFSQYAPNRAVTFQFEYTNTGKAAIPGIATQAASSSIALQAMLANKVIPLQPSHMPAFNGELLAGEPQFADLLKSLDSADSSNTRLAISRHQPSQRLLAIVFKIDMENTGEACKLNEQIRYACIESRIDN